MASTYHDLVTRFRADTSGVEAGAKRTQKAMGSVSKAGNRQAQVWTNVAYALDDAQYGFRGVQNNLQAVAVQAGASGPLVLGITAALVVMNFFAERMQKASRAAREFSKELAKAQGPAVQLQIYTEILKTANTETDAYRYALSRLKKQGYDPASQSLEKFIKLKEKSVILSASEAAITKSLAPQFVERIEQQEKLAKAIKAEEEAIKARDTAGDPESASFYSGSITAARSRQQSATDAIAGIDAAIKSSVAANAANITSILGEDGLVGFLLAGDNGKNGGLTIGGPGLYTHKWISDIGLEVEKAFEGNWFPGGVNPLTGSLFDPDNLNESDFKAWQVEVANKLDDGTVDLAGALKANLARAFVGLGEALGEAFADGFDGDSALKILGAFMQAFGSALITLGVGALSLGNLFANPYAAIAAGVLLVAGGAALAAASNNNPAGGGGGSSNPFSSGVSPLASLTSVQGGGLNNSSLVATVRGQDLRFILQGANDSYSARN